MSGQGWCELCGRLVDFESRCENRRCKPCCVKWCRWTSVSTPETYVVAPHARTWPERRGTGCEYKGECERSSCYYINDKWLCYSHAEKEAKREHTT